MKNEIAIIGTGLTGLVQALALATQKISVTLIGPMPKIEQDQRTTAILNPGIAFLETLGIWNQLKPTATPLATMELIDGATHSMFDASEIDEMQFGFNIGNAALKKSLIEKLQKNSFVTWHDTIAKNLNAHKDGWEITLSGNKKITCDLLIGADGRDSMTRNAANISVSEKTVDQSALVSVLQCEKPHFNTTVEWYNQGGPLTLVPVEKNKFALVWCGPAETQQQKASAKKSATENELTELTENRFGKIILATPLQAWKVRPMLADKMIGENCALIGEAAHVLPPIGAQGFNLGLHDARVLNEILTTAKATGQNFNNPILLQQYHRKRFTEISARYRAVNALNTSLLSRHFMLHKLRQVSLSGLQFLPFLKKQVMHKGMVQSA
jgi:2-octaprenyl-6-methoxyphenol hydroxylase